MKNKLRMFLCAVLSTSLLLSAPVLIQAADAQETTEDTETKQDLAGLKYDHSLELQYADQFSVDYYEDGYALITIEGDGQFLLVPDGKEAPDGLDSDIAVIRQPLQNIYLVATSAMDLFCALDGLDSISLSGTNADGWYIDEAKKALEDGSISFAGKYSAPDYELILSKGCDLAIESTMIYHKPEVKEKLEQFGIPVLVEHSSYESHPLGRTEWLKLYGVLLGKEDLADKLFQEQVDKLKAIEDSESTGKTVAFFYINSVGAANVRKSGDYVSKMIELAGGKYVFENLGDPDSRRSTVNLQLEDFYDGAQDADFLVYNTTIDRQVQTLEDLLKKCSLLKDFKAVKNHQVWCTAEDMYQQSMSAGNLIEDFHRMLTGDDKETRYLYRLK